MTAGCGWESCEPSMGTGTAKAEKGLTPAKMLRLEGLETEREGRLLLGELCPRLLSTREELLGTKRGDGCTGGTEGTEGGEGAETLEELRLEDLEAEGDGRL